MKQTEKNEKQVKPDFKNPISIYVLFDHIAEQSIQTFVANNDKQAESILVNTIGKGQLVRFDLSVIKIGTYDINIPASFVKDIRVIKNLHKR